MQGKKNFTPQLFVSVNLLDMVPSDNFYRKLLTELDLHFIYKATQKYYAAYNSGLKIWLVSGFFEMAQLFNLKFCVYL